MNILSRIPSSNLYTLHAHTQFCDGHAEMEEFIKEAIKQGFQLIGFTPHSPIPFESSCNMSAEMVIKYFEEITRLCEAYPQIEILKGMEIDYLGDHWGPSIDYFRNMHLDFSIGSIHFIPSQDGEYVDIDGKYEHFKQKMHKYFYDDIKYVVTTFFNQSIEMVRKRGFDIIGHFDKIKHNGGLFFPGLENETWYVALLENLVDCIIRSGVIVEINTKAWIEHQQLFPSQRQWKRLIEAKVPIVVNSDAHYPALINASRMPVIASLEYLRQKSRSEIKN